MVLTEGQFQILRQNDLAQRAEAHQNDQFFHKLQLLDSLLIHPIGIEVLPTQLKQPPAQYS